MLKNKNNSWGKIIMNMAELHSMTNQPFEELIHALHDLLVDLTHDQTVNTIDFEEATRVHTTTAYQLNN